MNEWLAILIMKIRMDVGRSESRPAIFFSLQMKSENMKQQNLNRLSCAKNQSFHAAESCLSLRVISGTTFWVLTATRSFHRQS